MPTLRLRKGDKIESHPLKILRRIMNETDNVGGYMCPIDPMDAMQCDSCQ